MSSSHRRRRRRTGSTSRRYKPSDLVPIDPRRRRLGWPEVLACGAVGLVGMLLIALIWMVTNRTVEDQRAEIRDRAERTVAAQAATLAEEIRHELLLIDQSLTILQSAWKKDSASFDLAEWQKQLPALTSVADDLFIADETRIVRQGILPASVGQGIGSAYVNFPHGSLEIVESDGTRDARDSRLLIGQAGAGIETRQFLMYVLRPLDHPRNWLIGASFRSAELTRLYAEASLGFNGVAALIDTRRGGVQAIAGPSARRPTVDVRASPMLEAMRRSESGIWVGATAMDGVERVHGFRKVAGRDMLVVVGTVWSQAMAPADTLAAFAHSLAFVASGLVVVIGGLVLWEIIALRANRRRRREHERRLTDLGFARAELATLRGQAQGSAAQLRIVLDDATHGIALLDHEQRLTAWNQRFAAASGLAPDALRDGLPLDEMLRQQARAGLFGPVSESEAAPGDAPDLESEVARRVVALRDGAEAAPLTQLAPDGQRLAVRARRTDDGALVLVLEAVDPDAPARHATLTAAAPGAETIEW